MAQIRKINFAEFEPTGDNTADLERLKGLLQEAFDDVYEKLTSGASGEFTTVDSKTVEVQDGVVTNIS